MPNKVSTARLWNEAILFSIRNDLARPTVTARNLYHLSVAMWNSYASLHDKKTFLQPPLNKPQKLTTEDFNEVLSYAAYSFLINRYWQAPGNVQDNWPTGDGDSGNGKKDLFIETTLASVLKTQGYIPPKTLSPRNKDLWDRDTGEEVKDLPKEFPVRFSKENLSEAAQFGLTITADLIAHTVNDGSREKTNFDPDPSYKLIHKNLALDITNSGFRTPIESQYDEDKKWSYATGGKSFVSQVDINYWVPLFVPNSIDQGGSEVESQQAPLTLHWGQLPTFSQIDLKPLDPGQYLPRFSYTPGEELSDETKDLILQNLDVIKKSALLNPVDISSFDFDRDGQADQNPGADYKDFGPHSWGGNDLGANNGTGYNINPVTNQPYQPNMVKMADFGRSIAEFWADGPNSETPPGHWNTLANYTVNQQMKFGQKLRWNGKGQELSKQHYELRLYLTLNGALHDAAIAAWSIKGKYQGNRPITVIRKLAELAEKDPHFASQLVQLAPEHLKMTSYPRKVVQNDGTTVEVSEQKLVIKAWRGHAYLEAGEGSYFDRNECYKIFAEFKTPGNINDYCPSGRNLDYRLRDTLAQQENEFYVNRSVAGAGWILAENWLPYQKTSFVTPPFPGFVSGHSTFSRAAAEVLAHVTGSKYFPGGLGEYPAPKLEFEHDQRSPFNFQWATYYDASDESGVSRIYGGIHASYDDLPARKIGSQIGIQAFKKADEFFKE